MIHTGGPQNLVIVVHEQLVVGLVRIDGAVWVLYGKQLVPVLGRVPEQVFQPLFGNLPFVGIVSGKQLLSVIVLQL